MVATNASEQVESIFRACYPKMVASLTSRLGASHLDLAENVVQDALIKAMQVWPLEGLPDNPEAWIYRVAKNAAIDHIRRQRTFDAKSQEIKDFGGDDFQEPQANAHEPLVTDELTQMIYLTCHPVLTVEEQVALSLKVCCGFGVDEIARAFLVPRKTLEQRLVRAKKKLREENVRFDLPQSSELAARQDVVLLVIYLLFNEGYGATAGERHIQNEICVEAIRLGERIAQHSQTPTYACHALLALMYFQGSRLNARADDAGDLVRLEDQNRESWDGEMIERGFFHLNASIGGDELTSFHLQASIAMRHATSSSFAETDWAGILSDYDSLAVISPQPIVRLNRAVAVLKVHGPKVAWRELQALAHPTLQCKPEWHALAAEILTEMGEAKKAIAALGEAKRCSQSVQEQAFYDRRMAKLTAVSKA